MAGWRGALSVVALVALAAPAWAQGPVPPCDEEVAPSPAPAGAAPVVRVWQAGDLPSGWVPPACSGWTVPGLRMMVAISGRLDAAHAVGVPARLAAISHFAGIRFWAVGARAWQVLVREAHALDGAQQKRADFTASDLVAGQVLDYSEADNGTGDNRYRMRVLVHTPDRLVVTTQNTQTIGFLLLPLFHPGDLQALYVLERQTDGTWLFYSLTRIGAGAGLLVAGHAASLVNRAMGVYRYLGGVPTDEEPPAAR
jgi:hypothetical protein